MTPDPVRDGTNWYQYVSGDPVNLWDPLGLICEDENGATELSDEGLAFIADYEGFEPNIYNDQGGRPTIGYGHLIQPGEDYDEPLTEEETEELLRNDSERFVDAVNGAVTVGLEQHEFDACVSLAYNIGENYFARSQTVQELNNLNLDTM